VLEELIALAKDILALCMNTMLWVTSTASDVYMKIISLASKFSRRNMNFPRKFPDPPAL
jgi:hypothetical protein